MWLSLLGCCWRVVRRCCCLVGIERFIVFGRRSLLCIILLCILVVSC